MKFLDAASVNGDEVRFWVKQGWTDARTYAAIQFGMFDARNRKAFLPPVLLSTSPTE